MAKQLPALGFWWLACLLYLAMGPGMGISALAQATEICNNGIDDDGDRLVDCQDPDCPECARFISCVQPNTCYMPPTWADPKSPTAVSDATDNVYGAQDLVLSTNADFTTVTIRTLDGSYTRTVVVTSTGSTIVQLPLAVVMSNSPGTVQRNKGLIITSTEPVQATYRQTPGLNQDIVPLKCRAALGYAFYAGSQTRLTSTNVANERHFVSVMATQPNTVVTFRMPTSLTLAGAGSSTFSVTLQEGETYMLASRLINNGGNSANESVSGVLVTSTQPIVVNSGSQHTGQPFSGNRDAGIDQLVPARTVGTSYVALHGQNTTANSDYVFVVAIENGTTVSIAGPATAGGASSVLSTTTLSAGQVFTYNLPNVPNRAYTINTGKKAYVYHVSSYAANEFGMGILPTINPCNGSKRIDFYRTTGSSNDQAVVMVPTAGLASLTFRGAAYTTYGTVVDNITVGGVAYSVVSFPNGSINAAGVVNTVTSTERFHVGVVSNTGGASTGNFGFYSNYEAQVDVLSPSNKQPTGFYTVAQVRTGVATPHCLTLTSCGSNDRITGIVNGTYTEATSFTGACLTYTMKPNAPKCARDTIRVQVENDIGRQGIVCLEFVNIDNDLITTVIPENPVVCQPGGRTSLTIVASQIVPGSGITYTYQTITPDKQLISTSVVSGTATGQYRISVTDSNGCRDTSSVFANPETASIAFGTGPLTVCQGTTATYSVNSTTGTYGWTITGGTVIAGGTPTSNSVTVRWTGSGSVRVTVTSANGCTAVATRSVALFPSPTPTATTQNPLCNGTSTGSVNLAVTGGTSPYTYRWNTGATTEDLANIPAGVYSVTVADRNGCLPTSNQPLTVTLTNATALSVVTSRTNLVCNGATTGTAGITASGGIIPYRYQWSTGATTQNVTGLAAGSYTVTATDANGCLNTQVVSITQPAALSPITSRTNVACNGVATGSIGLSVSGGTSNYTYRWNDGSVLQNRTGLIAGTYSVTVTDAANCTANTAVLITEPTALTLSAVPTNVLCNGAAQGSIDLTVSGGMAGYSYRWTNSSGQQIATTEDVSGLMAGVYAVIVTDANACTRTLSATINQPTALSLTLTPRNPTCNGGLDGAITLTVGGGTSPQTFRWSDGNTNPSRTGLSAGTYSVTTTDANGCSLTATTILSAPSALIATANVTNAACSGGSTGAIAVTPSGGTGAYSYTWNTGSNAQNLSNLSAGEYTVRIRDANGCSFTLGAAVRQPNPLSVTVLTTDAPCFGGSGNITTEVRGGTPAYSYRWSNGATSSTIFALPAGTYQLVVTDANSCTAQTSAVINQPPDFAINAVVVPVSCNGGANASIDVTIEGGTAPYRYRWSTGSTSQDMSSLPAGVYSVTVTDRNNCIEKVDINVQEPALVSLSQNQTNVSCFGGNNGAIDVTVAGGTRPYSFSWTDGITTEDRSALTAGTYRLTMTDKNGCAASLSVVITQPSALTVLPSVTAVSCNGGANGAVSLNVSGGVSETSDRPYRYFWTSGSTASALSGLVTGVYVATVTDANNCSLVVQNRVDQPTALTVNTTQQNILCNGGTNGQITVTVSGGTPDPSTRTYRYRWNDGNTAQNRTGLSAGIYSLTITDANNCTQMRSFTLTQPTTLSLTGAVQPVACFGGNTGEISLTVSGGVGPYDTRWSDGNTTPNRTILTAGTYSVTLTDTNNCTISRTFSVSQPTTLSATGGTRNISCLNGADGTISLTVSGGTLPYSFTWTGAGANASTQNQTGLAAGFYPVVIRDANGCQITRSFSLTQPDALRESHQVTPVSCQGGNNGAITLTASGGTPNLSGGTYRYRWNTGATTQNLSGLTAGIYSLTITDAQQCTLVTSATVSQPTALTLSAQSTPNRCAGDANGTVDLTVSGGTAPYRYLWNTGAITEDLTGVSAGTYIVTVRDFNNCLASITVVVSQPPALTLTLLGRNNRCVGDIYGAINLTVTGGTPGPPEQPYRYVWYNLDNLENGIGRPDQNVGDLMEGSYTVIVTDANGCTATGSTTLKAPPRLMSVSSTTNVECFGSTDGAISVSAWGGVPATSGQPYSYSWVDGYDIIGPNTPSRTNLPANVYTVTIRDQNGCFTTEVITINQPSALSLTGASTSIACNGASTGSVSVTASGGTTPFRYQWNDAGPGSTSATRTNLPAGGYSVTVTDANRCAQVLSLTVAQPTALSLASAVQNVSCDGGTNGSVSLTVAGGVSETSGSPYRYQWSTGTTTQNLTNLPRGNYSVTVTDANGCTIAANMAVEQPLSLTASVLGTDAICNGQFGTITTEVRGGTPAYSYRWSNRDGGPGSTNSTINGLPVGSYTVVVTDANGCTASAATSVSQPQPFNLNAVVVPVACQGGANGSIDLTAEGSTPPYRYRWSNGATTEDVSGLLSGIYSVTVLDVNNCVESTTINVGQPGSLSVSLSSLSLTCFANSTGQISITARGGTAPYAYRWIDNGLTSSASTSARTGLAAGTYSVTVTDANGCSEVRSANLAQPTALSLSGSVTAVACKNGNTGRVQILALGGTSDPSDRTYQYRWSTGQTGAVLSSVATGVYAVTATDANGCSLVRSYSVAEPTALSLNSRATNVACNGAATGQISLTVSGGTAATSGSAYSYRWNDGSAAANRTGLVAGTYSVTATDANGCFISTSVSVSQPTALSVTSRVQDVSCNGGANGSVSLTVIGGVSETSDRPYRYQWSTGATTQNVSNLLKGNYSVTVTDANGCTIAASVAIEQPLPLTASVLGTDAICNGQFGTITTEVRGGTPAYSYLWSSGSTGSTINGLPVGNYTLAVTDANGCTASAATSVSQPQPFNLNAVVVPVACQGGSNGRIDLTAEGSTPPYRYRWSTGATTQDVSGLLSGIYSVTVLDVNNCVESTTINVGQPGSLSVSLNSQNLTCFANATGQISVMATGGIGPYTYRWIDGNTTSPASTSTRMGLAAGLFSITVTDANGCSEVRSANLSQPTALSLIGSVTAVACNGGDSGIVSVTASGGTSATTGQPYTFNWQNPDGSPGANSALYANIPTGLYSVTASDTNGCLATLSLSVTQPTALSLASAVQNVSCDGGTNGSASLTVAGGVSETPDRPYRYQWSTGATTQNLTNLPKGNYSVTVTDANGCTIAASVAVSQPLPLTASVLGTDAICNGQFGTITTEVRGGTPAYSYLWSSGSTTSTVNGLPVGSYTLMVTDANGCLSRTSTSISQPQPFNLNAVVVPVSCQGGANGSIDLTAEGSTPPYRYRWSNGATTQDVSDLLSGIYSVTVLDVNDCVESTTINVGQPGSLSVGLTSRNLTCFENATGQISLTASGGIGPYLYTWSDNSSVSSATTPTRTGLSAGLYSVTVTDANGCAEIRTLTVVEPTALTVLCAATDVTRNGEATGSLSVTVLGGTPQQPANIYQYQWSTGAVSSQISNLTAGVYALTVTDANGCFEIKSLTVSQATALSVSSTSVNVACFGGSTGQISLTPEGGVGPYTYAWTDGNSTPLPGSTSAQTGLPAGTYSVTITDANGATLVTAVTITQPPALMLTPIVQPVSCNGGSDGVISLSVSGGSITAMTGTGSSTGSGGGSSGGNGSTTGYSYRWNTGASSSSIGSLTTGVYSVTVRDANGCTALQSVTVGQPSALSLSSRQVNVNINGQSTGAIDLTVRGGTATTASGYSYVWSDGGATTEDRSGLSAGVYSATARDANGCVISTTLTITEPSALTLETSVQNVACSGGANGAASVTATGGVSPYQYQWSNRGDGPGATTQTAPNLPKGNYEVLVTDANGATAVAGVAVAQPLPLTVSALPTNALCFGERGTTTVEVRGGTADYHYRWTTLQGGLVSTSATIQSLPVGTYRLVVTDANGCTATTRATVGQPDPFNLNAIVTTVKCQGGSDGEIDLLVEGATQPYRYKWSNGATSQDIESLTAGAYSVTVTDANNCTQVTTIDLGQPEALSAVLSSQNLTCFGDETGQISVTATGGISPYLYVWGKDDPDRVPGFPGSTSTLTGLSAGNYLLLVLDANGCPVSQSVTVNQPTALTVTGTTVDVTRNGDTSGSVSVNVTGGTPGTNPPYRYQWNTGATTATVNNLPAGIYSVTATDANGCLETRSFTISEPSALTLETSVQNVACSGGANGAASVTATGGVSPYQYQWSNRGDGPGATTQTITNLPKGNYEVLVTDANGATALAGVAVAQPLPLTVSALPTNALCFGERGTTTVEVRGGTADYRYRWTTLQGGLVSTSATIQSLPVGTYRLVVTDANGCTATTRATVGQPDPFNLNAIVTTVKCQGGSDGKIDLLVEGATQPYRYKWSNGATTEDLSDLTAGAYSVTVTDANNCTQVTTINLGQPEPLNVALTSRNLLCFGDESGQISLTATGGIGPYTYVWNEANGATSPISTSALTDLLAGPYSVTVLDANGCSVVRNLTVVQPTALSLTSSVVDVAVNGASTGRVSLTVSGGTPLQSTGLYTYRWMDGTTVSGAATPERFNLPAGVYSVTVTDTNGCVSSTTLVINQPTALTIQGTVKQISCDGLATGQISLTTIGGVEPYAYRWNTSATSQNLTNIPAGNYEVLVTDANGATATAGFAVTQPLPLTASVLSTDAQCNGQTGTVTTEVRGGTPDYQYLWSNGSTSASVYGLAAGSYTLTVTDANGCQSSVAVGITQPEPFDLNAVVVPVSCRGGANGKIDLTVEGTTQPYRYQWSTRDGGSGATTQDIQSLTAGTYSVTVTDANNCVKTTSIVVQEPPSLSIAVRTSIQPTCYDGANGSISLTATGGSGPYSYSWMDNGTLNFVNTANRTGLRSGVYSVTVSDANGCSAIQSVSLAQGTRPNVRLASIPSTLSGPTSRNDGQLILGGFDLTDRFDISLGAVYSGSAVLPASLSLVPANGVLTRSLPNPSAPQPYTVRVFDARGCSTDITVILPPSVFVCPPEPVCLPVTIQKTRSARKK